MNGLKFNIIFLIFFLLCQTRAEAVRLSVLQPGALEQVLEAGRDFYVIGRLDREGRSAAELPVDIRVEVAVTGDVRAGEKIPLRTVRSHVDRKSGVTAPGNIFYDYEGRAAWADISREALIKSPPPDLVFLPEEPASFFDPAVKAAVTENSFAALVQGGATKDYDTDYEKVYSGDLQWKLYRVFVDALSGDEVLASSEFDVMFGTQQEKILASFSPPEHLAAVERFALPRGIRLYKDAMPGYWSFGLATPYEIPLRARRNLALEYLEGRVHAVIYNITAESDEQRVALGHIAFQGWLESGEVFFYHYDVGEPVLTYEKWGVTVSREGVITRFGEGERLKLTRAEISGGRLDAAGRAELFPVGAVVLNRGETLRLYGAAAPLQPLPSQTVPEEDATFSVLNRIDKVRYLFIGDLGSVLHEEEHAVGLTRSFGGRQATSIYEFGHALTLAPRLRGKALTVRTQAFDKHGKPVAGTEEDFLLWVRE